MIASEDRRLARLTKICLALPEAAHRECGSHAAGIGSIGHEVAEFIGGSYRRVAPPNLVKLVNRP